MSFENRENGFEKEIFHYFSEIRMKIEFPCPDEETLFAFIHDRADRSVREDVEKHLLECDRCLKTVITCFNVLDTTPPRETEVPSEVKNRAFQTAFVEEKAGRWHTVRRLWASAVAFVSALLSPAEEECVYVRGEKKVISNNLVILEKVFREIKLQIEVEKTGHLKSNIKVSVQDPDGSRGLEGVRVDIMADAKELASFMTMKGEALFENLAFGKYTVKTSKNGKKLGEVLLKIEE